MSNGALANIDNYELVTTKHCDRNSNTAGGVALYRRYDCAYSSVPLLLPLHHEIVKHAAVNTHIGEISVAEVIMSDGAKFVFTSVYIHPNLNYMDMEKMMFGTMLSYSSVTKKMFPQWECDLDIPIIIMGDFNINVEKLNDFRKFILQTFNTEFINDTKEPTTLGNALTDLSFARNINASCKPYISYFSYHTPVFNKVLMLCDK
jgi:exonuclease III